MELIISSKKKLLNKYGSNNFLMIEKALHKLRDTLKNDDIDSLLIYIDDGDSLSRYRLQPVDPEKPEQIKELLDILHKTIEASYHTTIEYFLLIGGDDIVPFYRVSNPIYGPNGDPDKEIYSDNIL